MKLRLKQLHKPAEILDEDIPQVLCNIRCLSSWAIGFESPHSCLFGFTRRSSLEQNYIGFDKSDVTPTCSSSTPKWMSQGSTVFIKNFTKKSKDDSLVHLARYLRLLSPQHAVVSYTETNRIDTVAKKFISKGPEPDTTNTSEQNPTEIPTEPDTVANDTSQELPSEQANSRCKRAPSTVKTVESPSDVGLNVSPAKQFLEETSSPPLPRGGRLRKQRQVECGDYVYYWLIQPTLKLMVVKCVFSDWADNDLYVELKFFLCLLCEVIPQRYSRPSFHTGRTGTKT